MNKHEAIKYVLRESKPLKILLTSNKAKQNKLVFQVIYL